MKTQAQIAEQPTNYYVFHHESKDIVVKSNASIDLIINQLEFNDIFEDGEISNCDYTIINSPELIASLELDYEIMELPTN